MKVLIFTFLLLHLILSMDNENDGNFFLNYNYESNSDTDDEENHSTIDNKKTTDKEEDGSYPSSKYQLTNEVDKNKMIYGFQEITPQNLNPPLSGIKKKTEFHQENSNNLSFSEDSTLTSPFHASQNTKDRFQGLSNNSLHYGSWNESPFQKANSRSSLNTYPFHGSKFPTSMNTSPFHMITSPIHPSSNPIPQNYNPLFPNENSFSPNHQLPPQMNANMVLPFQFTGPNNILNYQDQQDNDNGNDQDWLNDSIFNMTKSDDDENDFENPFNMLKHSTESTVDKKVHESFKPQFMYSKSYDEENFEKFPIFSRSKTAPVKETTEKDKKVTVVEKAETKRLLHQSSHPKNNENQERMKKEIKEDYKDGAFRHGGKQEHLDRAKKNLRSIYAAEIETIKNNVRSECIMFAPLPRYEEDIKTISMKMHDLFNDAQRAQKEIDPFVVADYIPFMECLNKIIGNKESMESMEKMEPEQIILSKIGIYYLFTIYFKLRMSQNRFLFDI